METIDTYIVRIYRRDESNPHNISGIVEIAGEEEKRTFRNRDELLESLDPSKIRKQKPERKKGDRQ